MAVDPEELLRSIERTREDVAHTVDTIAGRLDPTKAAKRGAAVARDRVVSVVEGARAKLEPVPKPAVGGVAALVALAAIMAVRRRRR